MIIKSFNLDVIKKLQSNFYLLYGENEGHKDEVINNYFLKNFNGEIVKYDEDQILANKDIFFETCLNESLFESEKLILVNRVTSKLYEIIVNLVTKKISNKKIIFNSSLLDKKSKIRKLFETEKDLICIAFYQDNNISLFRIATDFFKKNNIQISSENINLILDKCSCDRKNLYNEMNKILNFSFEKKKINRDQIIKLINVYEDENYFELIDNCLAKNQVKVNKIINNNTFNNNETIILIRTFLSRLKRLIELKKLERELGNSKDTINNFRPPIFWKDKEMVEKQIKSWNNNQIYLLLDKVNNLEIDLKRNYYMSNNLIFDLILNTSNS